MAGNAIDVGLGLATALACGMIVGLERGWRQRNEPEGSRVAGWRTFALFGLLGGLAGIVPWAIGGALVLAAGLVIHAGYRSGVTAVVRSATTAIVGLVTIAIGYVAVTIDRSLSLGCATACLVLLNARSTLHALLRGVEEAEVDAIARFLLVALVVLPLLPDQSMGPFGAWNPRRIWMVVVMVSGLSFAGYAATRRWGRERGLLLVAASGALVSSTAVTVDYARKLREQPEAAPTLIAGIALASLVMFLRVQAITLALAPWAWPTLGLILAPGVIVAAVLALLAWRRQEGQPAPSFRLGNPLAFGSALALAAMVAVLSVAARWALARFGDQGMAVVLALTGLMDVDAAVLTLSGLPQGSIDAGLAGALLAGPVLANTLVKAGMAMAIAPGRAGLRAAAPLLLAFAASAIALGAWVVQWR
jgi:uncharacterized membrane protein (DUF4010 family)